VNQVGRSGPWPGFIAVIFRHGFGDAGRAEQSANGDIPHQNKPVPALDESHHVSATILGVSFMPRAKLTAPADNVQASINFWARHHQSLAPV